MAKKFIGIELEIDAVRVVVAEAGKTGPTLLSAREIPLGSEEDALHKALSESLGDLAFGDRLAGYLPAVGSFYRRLEFPFSDPKKIAAALPLEMAGQVPNADDLEFDFLPPQPQGHQVLVAAAAVKKASAASVAERFQSAGYALHVLDLAPFVFVAGLQRHIEDGILACLSQGEITLSRISQGKVMEYRCFPQRSEQATDITATRIQREYLALSRGADQETPALYLMGSGASAELLSSLRAADIDVHLPAPAIDGQPLDAKFLPAAALALRAALPEKNRQLNFLKGDLAPKSEWAGFRRRLIGASVAAGLALIITGVGAYLNYAHKVSRAEALRSEMTNVFRQTFPQATVIVDVPAQMRSSMAQLQERARLLGLGSDRSALSLLREISARTPVDVILDVRELNLVGDQLRIDGTTSSFEAINRLSRSLEGSPLFHDAQITDAKMGLDGARVDFRLNMRIAPEELIR